MKNLSKNQWIATLTGLLAVGYIFFGGTIMKFLNPGTANMQIDSQLPTSQKGFTSQDLALGSGQIALTGDTVTVHYVGTLTDGRIFDSSLDRNMPFTFTLGVGQVIRGWDEGVAGMREGGKRMLVISPDYAYGGQTIGGIPANSTLIFEVELLEVKKP